MCGKVWRTEPPRSNPPDRCAPSDPDAILGRINPEILAAIRWAVLRACAADRETDEREEV